MSETAGLSAADFSGEEAAELQPPELEVGSSILLSPLTSMRSWDTFLFLGGRVDSSSPAIEFRSEMHGIVFHYTTG